MLFPARSPRKFEYKPRYYDPEKEEQEAAEEKGEPRIKFRHLRRRGAVKKSSMRRSLLMLILVFFALWYLYDLAREAPIEVESIQLEDVSPEAKRP